MEIQKQTMRESVGAEGAGIEEGRVENVIGESVVDERVGYEKTKERTKDRAKNYISHLENGDLAGALCLARAHDWTKPLICYYTSFFIDKLIFAGDRQRAAQVAAAIGNDTPFYLFNRLKREMNILN